MDGGNLGERVRAVRKARDLSQEALAREAGVSLNLVNKLERGVVTDPHYSTLSGIARALDVPVQELVREPAVPLDEAPKEAGLDKQLAEELEDEEEQHVASIHPSALEYKIKFIRSLKEQREAEIEEVKQGAMPRAHWNFHLQADNKYLEIIYQVGGVFAFVEEVTSGRRMTDFPVQRLCHEFSRHFSDFVKLADEARVLDHEKQSDIDVEGVKGSAKIEAWLHEQSPKS